ncbi:Detected protein of unknown function [Hibiscus syriacus]|uniref:Uncharacterized protein n=1 Tax=Hibiscus syriacus TaxID=106335 RepID=A0A6A2ZL00_HIBSY|nr:Detected protein of unknown function [Hibiscus syriacus]
MELSSTVDLITTKLELNAMKAFLEVSEKRSGVAINEMDNQWVASVRDIATKSKRRRVAVKLLNINKRIKIIAERNQRYRVFCSESRKSNDQIGGEYHRNNWVKNLSESALFLKDDDLVGIDKAQQELIGWLMDQELRRTVTSVVGMGGLGKTALVANTFNKQVVKQHFDCCVWITVSQQYVVTDLFKSMIKELYGKAKEKIEPKINLDSMNYRELLESLVSFLEPRRYLIVIDDVWSNQFWQDISIALPANMNGSRILLTTRKEEVASFTFGAVNHIHRLKILPFDESLALFCKKAFVGKGGQCPPYLESLASKLVAKCEALPLAIVALGGLMASKNSIPEWNEVYNNLNRELSENDTYFERLKYISLLSYHDLSYRSIPEVVAGRYLTELICRGLLQIVSRNGSGRLKECKMHDIFREFAVSISKSVKFVVKSDGIEEVEDNGIRRWSIEAKEKEMKSESKAALYRVRTLFVFAVNETSKSSFNKLPSGFKLMRVLDLEDTPIDELPHELVYLFNLRYLNLTGTQVKELPKSIGKLYNLQSLDMRETQIKELPAEIVKLKNLRHLIAYRLNINRMEFDCWIGIVVPSNICLLNNLQILNSVEARGDFIKQLRKMTLLRELKVGNVHETDEKNLCVAISKMVHLESLGVKSCNEDELLKMDALESAPPDLADLFLAGKLEKVPHWFNSLNNLTYLYLHWSRLRDDFLARIQALPNLRHFSMVNAYEGEKLFFLEGFQKLKVLTIGGSPRLKEIVINKGVMPVLQDLYILYCQEFTTLPHDWEHQPDLKQVCLISVAPWLLEKIWRLERMDEQAVTGIMLSRQKGTEAVFKITRWFE